MVDLQVEGPPFIDLCDMILYITCLQKICFQFKDLSELITVSPSLLAVKLGGRLLTKNFLLQMTSNRCILSFLSIVGLVFGHVCSFRGCLQFW